MSSTDTLDLVWGAKEIGRLIGRTERETFYLLATGQLRGAVKKGDRWCMPRKALRANFYIVNDPFALADASLFERFDSLMQRLSPQEQEEVLQYWAQAG